MAVINILRDGTIVKDWSEVKVPEEIVRSVIAIADTVIKHGDRPEQNKEVS